MDPHSAAYQARAEKLSAEFSAVIEYYSSPSHGGNYLGLLLKTMAELMKIIFDRSNTEQYLAEVLKKYNKILSHPLFKPIIEKDKALSVCFSFASMLGTFIEEMNDRPFEEPSALFQSVNDHSVMDLKAVEISPVATRKRRSLTVTPAVIEHRPIPRAVSLATTMRRSSLKGEPETVHSDVIEVTPSSLADRIKARAVRRVAATPAKSVVAAVKSERKRPVSVADFDTTPAMVIQCAECGEKVKQSSLRRHMKGHGWDMGARRGSAAVNSMADGEAFTEDDNEPIVKKPSSIVADLSKVKMEMEAEDDEEELVTMDKDYEMLHEWMANAYSPVYCFSCNQPFPTFKTVSNHLYSAHGAACHNVMVFKCLGCNSSFRSYRGAAGHVKKAITTNEVACKNKVIYCPETENPDGPSGSKKLERMDDDPRSPMH